MNERMLELCKQSGISILWEYDGYDGHAAVCNFEDIEKLTELIVLEAVKEAKDDCAGWTERDQCLVGQVLDRIKQHFGVEE